VASVSKREEVLINQLHELRPRLLGRGRQYSGWPDEALEDAFQHVMLKALLSSEVIKPMDEPRRLAYLSGMLVNHIRDVGRRKRREEPLDPDAIGDLASPELPPEDWVSVTDEQWAEAIEALPTRMREAYRLCRQGRKHREIAEAMGITIGCVGKLMFEARDRLRVLLERPESYWRNLT
jgi:RNA polymerase sigma factor (sigma-70 family)